jgi:hypothetical protein
MNPRLDLHISTNLAAQVQKKTMRSTMFVGYVWLCIMKKIPLKATLFCCLNSTFYAIKHQKKPHDFAVLFLSPPARAKKSKRIAPFARVIPRTGRPIVWSSTDRPQWRFFFMIPYQYENMD